MNNNTYSAPIGATEPIFDGEMNHAPAIAQGDPKQLVDVSNASRERSSREKLKNEQDNLKAMGVLPPDFARVTSQEVAKSRLREHKVLSVLSTHSTDIPTQDKILAGQEKLKKEILAGQEKLQEKLQKELKKELKKEILAGQEKLQEKLQKELKKELKKEILAGQKELQMELKKEILASQKELQKELKKEILASQEKLQAMIANNTARAFNSAHVKSPTFARTFRPIIVEVGDRVGNFYPNFPDTLAKLNQLSRSTYEEMRTFYGGEKSGLDQDPRDVRFSFSEWMCGR